MNAPAETLAAIANQLRIHSIAATTAAGSGHVTSCCSAAELVAALFFGHMRFDPKNPQYPNNDRFILSKGHAAPLLYAAWAEAGLFPVERLLDLRKSDSDLEGHPTARLPFVDVATGSLGQGLSNGVGMAISANIDRYDFRTYVMMGDGECAEGSVWEAASLAGVRKLNNLVAIIDVNRLGQSQQTAFGYDVEVYRRRFEAFGWRAITIDGHNVEEILAALKTVGKGEQPFCIVARTIKGKGLEVADKDNWHGKPLPEVDATKAIATLRPKAKPATGVDIPRPKQVPTKPPTSTKQFPELSYKIGDKVATREAYGTALARIGEADQTIVALDGDVKNSTYSEKFFQKFPDRSVECFIAEQNMVGVAVGMGTRGKKPFASTFACFLSRAYDQIRMSAVSFADLKLCGSHAGISIGEDGPSQMGLEDVAMMRAVEGSVVLCPCDAVSTERLVEAMARHDGISYLRTLRPKTPVLYGVDEEFEFGGAKVLRHGDNDQITVVASGVTVHEALKAAEELQHEQIGITVIDAYSIKPLATEIIREAARKTNNVILTVEDHYYEGGLGEAVAAAVSEDGIAVRRIAVSSLAHSAKPEELMERFGIDAAGIVKEIRRALEYVASLHEEPFIA
jgi:transketolase